MVTDGLGRRFKSLRISLLSTCNFACIYCTDDDGNTKSLNEQVLSVQNLLKIVGKLHAKLGLDAVRLTGGEPLLHPDLELIISGLKKIGIPKIKMTTNAFLLANKAQSLQKVGLEEINISLDAIEDASFFKMTKRDKLSEVKLGIDAAVKLGLKVKLNAVIMRGKNDDQIIPLFNYAKSKGIIIRFLEVMAMGHLHEQKSDYLFGKADILKLLSKNNQLIKELPRTTSATANYYQTNDGYIFGIIANTSTPFCSDCNRLRLDQFGKIYGCLSVNEGLQIKLDETENNLDNLLQKAMDQKQLTSFKGSDLSMLAIGG